MAGSYPSAEMQSVYSAVPSADWATSTVTKNPNMLAYRSKGRPDCSVFNIY